MKMKTSPNDVSNIEILKEFKKLSDTVTNQIGGIETEIKGVNGRLDRMDSHFDGIDGRLETLKIQGDKNLPKENSYLFVKKIGKDQVAVVEVLNDGTKNEIISSFTSKDRYLNKFPEIQKDSLGGPALPTSPLRVGGEQDAIAGNVSDLQENLSSGIADSANIVNREGRQEVMGAVAGIEPEFDEEGNPIGMKYDPVKGALGVAGGIAVKKLKNKKVMTRPDICRDGPLLF